MTWTHGTLQQHVEHLAVDRLEPPHRLHEPHFSRVRVYIYRDMCAMSTSHRRFTTVSMYVPAERVTDMKRTHRWRAVSRFFPSLPPSRILSLFQRGAKGKSRYLFIGNCQRQTPRTCKQTAAVTLLCEHADARVFQHVKKADDTLMLLVFSWVLLTIREM